MFTLKEPKNQNETYVNLEKSSFSLVKSVYAIAFDLDTNILQEHYHQTAYNNAYTDIKKVLESHGFERQQGSVYFGNKDVDAVTCVLAVMDLSEKYSWFNLSVKDVRMLRIEDNNDLKPAVMKAASK